MTVFRERNISTRTIDIDSVEVSADNSQRRNFGRKSACYLVGEGKSLGLLTPMTSLASVDLTVMFRCQNAIAYSLKGVLLTLRSVRPSQRMARFRQMQRTFEVTPPQDEIVFHSRTDGALADAACDVLRYLSTRRTHVESIVRRLKPLGA